MEQRKAVLELVNALEEVTEKVRAVLDSLCENGSSLDGFAISHRRVMGNLWVLDDYIKQIEGRLTTFSLPPPANDD